MELRIRFLVGSFDHVSYYWVLYKTPPNPGLFQTMSDPVPEIFEQAPIENKNHVPCSTSVLGSFRWAPRGVFRSSLFRK